MGGYTRTNLRRHVENSSPKYGMPSEARAGLPDPLRHRHEGQEEVYVIVRGSARIKVDGEVVDAREWDAIRFDKDTMRNVGPGPMGSSTSPSAPATILATPR